MKNFFPYFISAVFAAALCFGQAGNVGGPLTIGGGTISKAYAYIAGTGMGATTNGSEITFTSTSSPGGSGSAWTNVTVPYSSIASALATNTVTLFELPAKGMLGRCTIYGDLINTNASAIVCRVGVAADTQVVTGMSVDATNKTMWAFNNFDVFSDSIATNVLATFQSSSTAATFLPLTPTNGNVTIRIEYQTLP